LVRPVTIIGEALLVLAIPPGSEVTVYEMIGVPPVPVPVGATNDTLACPFPGVATTVVGAFGVVTGMTAIEGEDEAPTPTELLAVTVN
jgi:hypothetical protein